MKRRDFLNLGALTATAVALAGCGRTSEHPMISQATMPEFYLPGIAQWYATACGDCGAGCGLAVRVIGGRAKKVEGLPTHPLSHGGHCLRAESALQSLYNPDRLASPLHQQAAATWNAAIAGVAELLKSGRGSQLWITGPLRGTLGALIADTAKKTGAKIWILDYPGTRIERTALKSMGDAPRLPWYGLEDADYVVNFGSDFLGTGQNAVHDGWAYGQFRRNPRRTLRGILVSFASRMSLTVGSSDRWVPVKPGTEGWVAAAVAGLVAAAGKGTLPAWADGISPKDAAGAAGIDEDLIHRLATKLLAAKHPIALGGWDNAAYSNGVWTLAVINHLNRMLSGGNQKTYEPDLMTPARGATVSVPAAALLTTKQAVDGLTSGAYTRVFVAGPNPVYQLPAKLNLAAALGKARTAVFTPFVNETSVQAEWVLPTTSFLEEWGEVRVDGPHPVYGIRQPVVSPQPGSLATGDVLLLALDQAGLKPWGKSMADVVQGRFPGNQPGLPPTSPEWLEAQERGGVWKEAPRAAWEPYAGAPLYPPPPPDNPVAAALPAGTSAWTGLKGTPLKAKAAPAFSGTGDYTLIPYPSPTVIDGSLANRPWLQELPEPLLQAVWTSWVEINQAVADKLNIQRGDLVRVESEAGAIELPALPSPTVHPEALAIPMGQGHDSYGRYAFNDRGRRGANPMKIVTPTWQEGTGELALAATRVTLAPTGKKGMLTTYDHRFSLDPKLKKLTQREFPE